MIPPSARCPTAVRGPRGASCEVVNAFVRPVDGRSVAHENRTSADRIGHDRPIRLEDQPHRHDGPGLRLGLKLRGSSATRDQNGRAGLDPDRAARRRGRHRNSKVGVGGGGGNRTEHGSEGSSNTWGRRTPVGREERDAVRTRGLVQEVDRPALTGSAPGPAKAHPSHVEEPVERDPCAGTRRARR